jgi:rhamnose utilization protein RhaD (predicted bifunctional aldolase and dehydrogenase)/NAD(P)-dependent dehydrogenase (short-subunit alcohol dehydrogenase family)
MVSRIPWPEFGTADNPLEQLVGLSHFYGSDIDFVIAAGGNTSVKVGDRLYVKASGTQLATIGVDGFVELDRVALDSLLASDLGPDPVIREQRFKDAILAARVHPEKGQRPSVECVLHHIIPQRFVVHTHATVANRLACSRRGKEIATELFGNDLLWIPYVDPGFVLARCLREALRDYRERTGKGCPRGLLLQNHGLIVWGDTPEEVRETTDWMIGSIGAHVGSLPPREVFGPATRIRAQERRRLIDVFGPLLRGLLADGESLPIVMFDDAEIVLDLVCTDAGKGIAARGPWTPDQIVYCGSFPLWFEATGAEEPGPLHLRLAEAVRCHRSATGFPPAVILVKGLGMFAAGRDHAAADDVRLCYTDAIKIAAGAELQGGAQALGGRDREFIEQWEVEAYRRKVGVGDRAPGCLADKVAMVTGSAQGFGLEIARELAAQGAHVVLADISREALTQRALDLASRHSPGRVMAVEMDVTDGDLIAGAVHQVVRAYGGLDLFVSNAGVLLAESVKTQAVRDFELVTNVNYKGFFLCVQKVAPILSLQHQAKPDYWSDIIQINSKSGLAGSNRNGAYAGSKFGGIGLTQSFALELLEDGIKVNAICPGNYFDGPLWSDPEKGLLVQYLRAGKVPGAKSIQDVRKAYEAKVPMGRGCTTADVMKAIYYLVEQKYETGQALPVTGGQIMLH